MSCLSFPRTILFHKVLTAACLLNCSATFAQTTPTSNPSTTRSTNTVGLSGTPTGSNATNAAPVRYDDPNLGMPSQVQVNTKATKTKKMKSDKMRSSM